MNGKAVVIASLSLLSRVNPAGAVDENRERRYFGAAPAYLTLLQYELASLKNLPVSGMAVTDLDNELSLDEDLCMRVMPAGLAMYFALSDHDEAAYNHFSKVYYESLAPSVKPDEVQIEDYYGAAGDPTMQ